MAYIKYKELSKESNFRKKMASDQVPSFVNQYMEEEEEILGIYGTREDTCVFTNKKLMLFDIGLFNSKKLHFFPYNKVASSAIEFRLDSVIIYFSFDSGYQTKVSFVRFDASDKTELRKIYAKVVSIISKK